MYTREALPKHCSISIGGVDSCDGCGKEQQGVWQTQIIGYGGRSVLYTPLLLSKTSLWVFFPKAYLREQI